MFSLLVLKIPCKYSISTMLPPRLLALGLTNSVLCNFVATFPYTVLNVPQDVLEEFVQKSFHRRYDYELSAGALLTLWGFFVCVWDIGGMFGAMLTAYLDEKFGRKDTLFVFCNLVHLFGCVLTLLAKPTGSFELLFIGRLIFGVSSGVVSTSMGVFVTECSPDRYRGFLGNFSLCLQPIICIIAMVLGLPDCLGNSEYWPYLLSFSGLVSFTILVITPLFRESPKYLYIECNDVMAAAESIRFYYGEREGVDKLRDILNEYDREAKLASVGKETSLSNILGTRHLRIPLLLSIVANLSQDTIGSDVVSNYSTDIMESLNGVQPDDPSSSSRYMLTTVFTLIPGVVSAILATGLAEWAGRKFLLISGLSGALLSNVVLMIVNLMEPSLLKTNNGKMALRLTSAFAFGLFNFAYYFGPASVPQYIYGEITPTAARSTVAAAAMIANYGGSTIYSLAYPPLSRIAGGYSFLTTILPTIVCITILVKWLPEPKGRSVDEIVHQWIDRRQSAGLDASPLLDEDFDDSEINEQDSADGILA